MADLGPFPAPWPAKLAVLRACILCCMESLADETDVLSAKLKQYVPEFKIALNAARQAANAAATTPADSLFAPILRG